MKFLCMLDWVLIALLYLTLSVEIWAKYPSNHGGGTEVYWWFLLCVAVLNLFEMMKRKDMLWLKGWLMVSFGLILLACNQFNILVEYETWIVRGMPVWGNFQTVATDPNSSN